MYADDGMARLAYLSLSLSTHMCMCVRCRVFLSQVRRAWKARVPPPQYGCGRGSCAMDEVGWDMGYGMGAFGPAF